MICYHYQPARSTPQAYCMPTLSTLLRGLYCPEPIRNVVGHFAILQARTELESRTRKGLLSFWSLNTRRGGSIYGRSVSGNSGWFVLPRTENGAIRTRDKRLFVHRRRKHLNNIRIEEVIAAETKRLSESFGKSFIDCEDLIKLTGLGRDNVRLLMRSRRFPVVKVGKRQVVSILSFVAWQIRESMGGDYNGR